MPICVSDPYPFEKQPHVGDLLDLEHLSFPLTLPQKRGKRALLGDLDRKGFPTDLTTPLPLNPTQSLLAKTRTDQKIPNSITEVVG